MKTTNKTEKILKLYKEVINSTNYNEILYNIYRFSKLEIENTYENLKNKISNLEKFFEIEKENFTKENLIKIFNEIEKQELYFDTERFNSTLGIFDIEFEKDLNNINKTELIKLIEQTIEDLIIDFENLIDYGNQNNQIEID